MQIAAEEKSEHVEMAATPVSHPQDHASRLSEWFRFAAKFVLLPNLPFIIAEYFFNFHRALINGDYLLVGLVSRLFSERVNLAFFFFLVSMDMLISASDVYHLPMGDVLRSLQNIPYLAPIVTAPITFMMVVAAMVWAKVNVRSYGSVSRHSVRLPSASLPSAFGLVLLLLAVGSKITIANRIEIAGSTLMSYAVRLVEDYRRPELSPSSCWRVHSATEGLAHDIASSSKTMPQNVVIVLVESFGLATDPDLRTRIVAPFQTEGIKGRYFVETGLTKFHDSTVAAEFRELCGANGGLRETRRDAEMPECLPAKLHQLGYRTTAIHGFTSRMFGRSRWYPRIGFDQRIFLDNWPQNSQRHRCGTLFEGICDYDAAQIVKKQLQSLTDRQFIYWLTVDSHLQLDGKLHFACTDQLTVRLPAQVCELVHRLKIVMSAMAEIAADAHIAPTRFIIVGDHAPPFIERRLSDLFSDTEVPYLELIPRVTQP